MYLFIFFLSKNWQIRAANFKFIFFITETLKIYILQIPSIFFKEQLSKRKFEIKVGTHVFEVVKGKYKKVSFSSLLALKTLTFVLLPNLG